MKRVGLALLLMALLMLAAVYRLNHLDEAPTRISLATDPAAEIQRGAYLAKAGNCGGCHS